MSLSTIEGGCGRVLFLADPIIAIRNHRSTLRFDFLVFDLFEQLATKRVDAKAGGTVTKTADAKAGTR